MNFERLLESPALILPWVILLLPLLGFTVLCLFGEAIKRDKEDRGAGLLATGLVLGSFTLAVVVFNSLLAMPTAGDEHGLRFVTSQLVLSVRFTLKIRLSISFTPISFLLATGVFIWRQTAGVPKQP